MNKKSLLLVIALVAILFILDKPVSFGGEAKKILEICQAEPVTRAESCYAKKFRLLSEAKGPEHSFAVLANLQKLDPVTQGCHLIAHGIGSGAFKRNPDSWQTLINTLSPSCSYGAIHGVIEHYAGSLKTGLSQEVVSTLCGSSPRFDCNHIVGHLILVEKYPNLGEAVRLCEVFVDSEQEELCLSGVFMEYQTARNLIAHGLVPETWANLPERLAELEAICRTYGDAAGIACWQEIVHAAAEKFSAEGRATSGGNLASKIYNFCATAQIVEGARRCRRHAIAVIAAYHNFELAKLENICIPQKFDPSFQNDCYIHIVDTTLANLPDYDEEMTKFCANAGEKFRQTCYNQIESNRPVKFHD